jgi:NAD(P)-dependent dehydrogenase (short-subunit alcohol dehydrogenase family)
MHQPERPYDYTGRTVAVTGGAGALGGEMAYALAACGANVAVLDVRHAVATGVAQRVAELPGAADRVCVLEADVLDRASLEAARDEIARRLGPVDTLINAAGGNKPSGTIGPEKSFFDISLDGLRDVLDLNLLGTILPCQVFGAGMAERGEGAILNIASVSSYRPLTRVVAYSAAKGAIANFTQWLAVHMAQEYSPRIRVNALAPGFFITDQNRFLLTERETGGLTPRGHSVVSHTPMGRFGQPPDLAGAVLWLLSPAAAFVTGVVLPVDGGLTAYSGI